MSREKIAKVTAAPVTPDLSDLELDEQRLTDESRELLSFEGLINAHARIVSELQGASEDTFKVVQARLGQLRALRQIGELVQARQEVADYKRLKDEVEELKRLRREGMGSATSFSAAPSIPREGGERAN